ncbi:hypothetical protein HED52_03035 [Ochrobactrum ciceri]|uniref:Uncharacterized protein n=1 Tax=Brucella ciceri TaxID=391287 RepID=A0ABX1DS17_9HYPH|nr:hypothetical protein [Brucella ciceri]
MRLGSAESRYLQQGMAALDQTLNDCIKQAHAGSEWTCRIPVDNMHAKASGMMPGC